MKLYSKLKPILFSLLVLTAACLSSKVAEATPYASGITNIGGTVNFILNEDADDVKVIYDGGGVGNTNNLGARVKGLHSFVLTPHTTWEIVVSKAAPVAWTKTSVDSNTNNQYFSGTSVAVYNNPSDLSRFGRIYISEASAGKPAASPATRLTYDGIYILNADQTDGLGRGTNTSKAGISFQAGSAITDTSRSPHKIQIGEDGLLYIADWSTNNGTVYRTDADVVTSEIVLAGIGNLANPTVHTTINGSPIAKGSTAGGNLQLWTIDGQWPNGGGFNRLMRYDINGSPLPYNSPPAAVLRTAGVSSVADVSSDLDIAPDGKFFLSNNRTDGTLGVYNADRVNLRVLDTDGLTVLWDSLQTSLSVGLMNDVFTGSRAVVVSPDGTKVVVSRNDTQVIIMALTNGIPDIGNRTTNSLFGSTTTTTTSHRRDACFDLAGNLYGINNQQEKLVVWSPGGNAVARTRSDGTFSIVRGASVNLTITDAQASETGPDTAQLTITRTGDTGAGLSVFFSMSGTAVSNVDYTLPAGVSSPIVIAAGQSSTNITLVPVDDTVREAIETVTFTVLPNANYGISGGNSVSATITDNDAHPSFWDVDGANPGAGGFSPAGNWGTDNFWSVSALGDAATTAWTNGNLAVFSAGTDAVGPFTVTLTSPIFADHLIIEEGDVTLTGSSLTFTNFDPIQLSFGLTTIDSVITGGGGLWLRAADPVGSTLILGANNTYTGSTLVETGTVRLAASERIPDSSALNLGSGGILDLNSFNETVGSLAGLAGSSVAVSSGSTFTFGGNNSSTTWNGSINGGFGGSAVKLGSGTTTIGSAGVIGDSLAISNGTVAFNGSGRLGSFNTVTIDNGAVLDATSGGVGADFVAPTKTLAIGAGGGTLRFSDPAAILFARDSSTISGTGTLIKDGPGELRTYTVEHSFGKLYVKNGLYTAGHSTFLGHATSFGAIPAVLTPDAITLTNGSQIRKAGGQNVILDPNQGITLQTGGGVIRSYSGSLPQDTGAFIIPGPISGVGSLTLNQLNEAAFAPIIVLGTNNTYAGGTALRAGTLYVTNSAGSATGTGAVNSTNSTLGGDGRISGAVVMQGGQLSPGYNFNTGPQPVTPVLKQYATLTLASGFGLFAGATNVWELGEYSTNNPGVDFDTIEVTGGSVVIDSSAVLSLSFSNNAFAPNSSDAFWATDHEWTIVNLSGAAINSTKFNTIVNGSYPGVGNFTNYVGAGGDIILKFVAGTAVPPVINPAITGATTGNSVLTWSSVPGTSYTVQYATNLTPPITWLTLTNLSGGPGATTSILDSASGFQTQRYYRIVIP